MLSFYLYLTQQKRKTHEAAKVLNHVKDDIEHFELYHPTIKAAFALQYMEYVKYVTSSKTDLDLDIAA